MFPEAPVGASGTFIVIKSPHAPESMLPPSAPGLFKMYHFHQSLRQNYARFPEAHVGASGTLIVMVTCNGIVTPH